MYGVHHSVVELMRSDTTPNEIHLRYIQHDVITSLALWTIKYYRVSKGGKNILYMSNKFKRIDNSHLIIK